MFRPGRRLFTVGSFLLLLTGVAHTIGSFQPVPPDPAAQALQAAMQGYRFDLGLGMTPSAWDINYSLSFTMSVMFFWMAILNLLIARMDGSEGRVVRVAKVLSVIGVGALVALYYMYRVPPPLVSLALVEACYLGALLPARR